MKTKKQQEYEMQFKKETEPFAAEQKSLGKESPEMQSQVISRDKSDAAQSFEPGKSMGMKPALELTE